MRNPNPALLALALCALAACTSPPAPAQPGAVAPPAMPADGPRPRLRAFADEAELQALFADWKQRAKQRAREESRRFRAQASGTPMPAPAPAAAAALDSFAAEPESITNVQTAGVDEGGIVKTHGEHLVVLRRGRLFTVRIGGDALHPVASIDAFPPGANARGDWYDEMLVSGDTVVVIGYSYARGGTEVGLFDIDAGGGLKHRDSYHLRSNDYYSSRNFASRLIGNQLVFYTPLRLNPWGGEQVFPAYRHWHAQATREDFKRILPATRLYRSDDELDPFRDAPTLHSVTRCDLSQREMQCESSAVLGPGGREFYVSQDAVYVWTTRYRYGEDRQPPQSSVFRIPLDGSAPTGLKTSGGPVDQLSFLQDGDGYLNVLVTAQADGGGMWASETAGGDTALLRVRISDFGDGSTAAPASSYRPLPRIARYNPQNRYIGDWLVYGGEAAAQWGRGDGAGHNAIALRYADPRSPVQAVLLRQRVERIEALGSDAVLVGNDGTDLVFTSVRLGAHDAAAVSSYVQPDAAQGETRTHGFFYKRQDAGSGIVGLPVVGRRPHGMQRYLQDSAGVLFLRNRELRLGRMGQLDAQPATGKDGCIASCVDWYGNARPIFIGSRVFALLGYELVEGRLDGERIGERRRVDFSPAPGPKIAE